MFGKILKTISFVVICLTASVIFAKSASDPLLQVDPTTVDLKKDKGPSPEVMHAISNFSKLILARVLKYQL